MNSSTRERLIDAASQLFARHGFRGAPVRDICNQARTNPGAVSYHFGGKRQLYRTVLRRAAERLAAAAREGAGAADGEPDVRETVCRVFRRIQDDPVAARLLLRDLADGGTIAVEALEPSLRGAVESLSRSVGAADTPGTTNPVRMGFLGLAAPLFLLSAAWPVVARALDLDDADRDGLLDQLIRTTIASGRSEVGSSFLESA
jgi:AcrR family transcriptional regulator